MSHGSAVIQKMMSVVLAMMLGLFLFGAAYAEENNAQNAQKELAAGVQSWSEQMSRAPHYGFTGTEYNKAEWPIIMMRMATIGQMPYSEALRIGKYLSLLAPEPKKYLEPLDWFNRNVVFKGIASVSSDLKGEREASMTYSQEIYARLGDRWLLQLEPEFNLSLNPGPHVLDFGFEYVHLTYFLGDHVQLTAGKIINDFNFSRARLHPSWINLSQDLPWVTGMVPESTLGGKIGWNYRIADKVMLNGSFFGGTGRELSWFDANPMFGARIGTYFPEKNLEFGVSYATTRGDHIAGGYFIKKIESVQLQGEVARSTDQGSAYWLEASVNLGAVLPVKNETARAMLNRVTPVLRWQQFFAKHRDEADAEMPQQDDASGGMMTMMSSGGHDEGSLPEKNASQLYTGINYELFRLGPYAAKLQAGYAFGFGGTDNQAKAGIVFRW
ncbi:hypothetical protein KGQ34_02805 [Patescibacteria group bacterium]|nr:hypothetical protein [Patescibacteria group bacterium]